jgi:glyoxylase-like metal-dependent hydrolase (beta-lactamase superfamily II)
VFAGLLTLALATAPTFDALPHYADTVRLHRYSATEASFDVNAYWLESNAGIVLIDALFLGSDATLLAEMIRSTHKPLVGILLTHPHVDHYGGVVALRKIFPEAPVFATAATADGIQGTHDRGIANEWLKPFVPDYGGAIRPDSIVPSGTTLELAGMHFAIRDLGAAEAENNTVIYSRELNALFTGDATVAHAPIYVGEGHLATLLDALKYLATTYPDTMIAYSGHYAPSPLGTLVADNLAQLDTARAIVRRVRADSANFGSDGRLRTEALRQIVKELTAIYSHLASYGYGPAILAEINLPGFLQEPRATP